MRGAGAPRVKICGMRRASDVRTAAEAGADYVGLVLAESPRRLRPSEAGDLARAAREAGVAPVGVVVDRGVGDVAELAGRAGFRVAQLHGAEPPETCARLREAGLEVWKALRPRGRSELEREAARYRDVVDALLVEGWSGERAGGTGTAFPHGWLEEAGLREAVGRMVLAGGLDPENVGEAVRRAAPDVVDVSSGVEASRGVKDPERVRAFVAAVRAAGREPGPGGDPSAAGTGGNAGADAERGGTS